MAEIQMKEIIKGNSHIDLVKTHFDMHHQRWKNLYHKFGNVNDVILFNRKNITLAFLRRHLKPGFKVLDAGCGAGVVAMDVVQRGCFVYGIDISEKMIDLCKQSFSQSGIHPSKYFFTVGNVIDIDLPDSSFDGILALGFLEYQKNEYKALEIFQKAIRPGGILVCSGPAKITIPNFFGLGLLLKNIYSTLRNQKPISINRYSLSRFKMLLDSHGFTLIDYKRHGYADFTIFNKIIGFRVTFFLHRALTRISSVWPIDRFADDIIVVARKK